MRFRRKERAAASSAAAATAVPTRGSNSSSLSEEEETQVRPDVVESGPPRCQFVIETASTAAQSRTEEECAPFFVDIRSLPPDQICHLRLVGLLPPGSAPISDKAAKTLGVGQQHRGGRDETEAKEEEQEPLVPSPSPDDRNAATARPAIDESSGSFDIRLLRKQHAEYLSRAISLSKPLPGSYVSLDSSRPWIIYWTLHSLDLIHHLPSEDVLVGIVSTLEACWQEFELELDDFVFSGEDAMSRHRAQGGDFDIKMRQTSVLYKTVKSRVKRGGFGGGPGQMAHCATTYAAVLALVIIAGSPSTRASTMAMDLLKDKRGKLYYWYLYLRYETPSKTRDDPAVMHGYRMHLDGEVDIRAAYAILCVASLLNFTTTALTRGAMEYLASCQTYEGGFGGEPETEAHGGYTFCAVAAIRLLLSGHSTATTILAVHSTTTTINDSATIQSTPDRTSTTTTTAAITTVKTGIENTGSERQMTEEAKKEYRSMEDAGIDVQALRGWLARRQMSFEGGFSGRSNKLVDGCYSFWQGSAIAILDVFYDGHCCGDFDSGVYTGTENKNESSVHVTRNIAPPPPLNTTAGGLLLDQELLQRYVLLCAQDVNGGLRDKPSKPRDFYHSCYNLSGLSIAQHVLSSPTVVYGDRSTNVVGATHPVYNVRVEQSRLYWMSFILKTTFSIKWKWRQRRNWLIWSKKKKYSRKKKKKNE